MNPAKRKKLYRAALREEAKKVSAPVVEESKPEPVVEKPVEQLPLGLKELPKEEPVVETASVAVAAEQPVAAPVSKKKKV